MRLPRPRFQLGWLMMVVAVVALILGAANNLSRRRQLFEQEFKNHLEEYLPYVRNGSAYLHEDQTCEEFRDKEYPPSKDGIHTHPLWGLYTKREREWMAYHDEMMGKYGYAAAHPWLPVSADPLPPTRPE